LPQPRRLNCPITRRPIEMKKQRYHLYLGIFFCCWKALKKRTCSCFIKKKQSWLTKTAADYLRKSINIIVVVAHNIYLITNELAPGGKRWLALAAISTDIHHIRNGTSRILTACFNLGQQGFSVVVSI
jgi:hypothetical protein